MQLSRSKTHPDGGVVIEAEGQVSHAGGIINIGEIRGLSISPTPEQKNTGRWTIEDQVEAANLFIEATVNLKTKKPGMRRWVPAVDRTKDWQPTLPVTEAQPRMKQYDLVFRHIARGDYHVEFAEGVIAKQIEARQIVGPEKEYVERGLVIAKKDRLAWDIEAARIAKQGPTGQHPLETLLTSQIAALQSEVASLKAANAQRAAK